MKKEIADRWVNALESGLFKQAKGSLNGVSDSREEDDELVITNEGHCCLGVLCELAVADGVIERRTIIRRGFVSGDLYPEVQYGTAEEFDIGAQEGGLLPNSVREWAGMKLSNPIFRVMSNDAATASETNDSLGYSFSDIANLVREQYENL